MRRLADWWNGGRVGVRGAALLMGLGLGLAERPAGAVIVNASTQHRFVQVVPGSGFVRVTDPRAGLHAYDNTEVVTNNEGDRVEATHTAVVAATQVDLNLTATANQGSSISTTTFDMDFELVQPTTITIAGSGVAVTSGSVPQGFSVALLERVPGDDIPLIDVAGIATGPFGQSVVVEPGLYTLFGNTGLSAGAIGTTSLDAVVTFIGAGGVTGDYNGSGQVEQGDLDLVLQNWGDDTGVTGLPAWWVNDNDNVGQVEQTELDRVLQNWGSTGAPNYGGFAELSGVPEPGSAAVLALAGLGLLSRCQRAAA